jgi:hypothetical protein
MGQKTDALGNSCLSPSTSTSTIPVSRKQKPFERGFAFESFTFSFGSSAEGKTQNIQVIHHPSSLPDRENHDEE